MRMLEAIVRGSVQGVGFRRTCQRLAQELEITGTVKNLEDGSVELKAYGSEKALMEFTKQLEARFTTEGFPKTSDCLKKAPLAFEIKY